MQPDTQSFRYRLATVLAFARRETVELLRDRIRLFFAVLGPITIMGAVSWGISFDVQNLKYAVYDRDQSVQSRAFTEYFSGSRYFIEQPPVEREEDIKTVLQNGTAVLVIDIPSGFGRALERREKPEIGFYVDGAMPFNATNIRGYVQSLVSDYTLERIRATGTSADLRPPAEIVPRFLYNQDFNSINAISPGVMMLALMMIPAMMAAVGVVREKEIGSITNFYASPASTVQPAKASSSSRCAASWLMLLWFGVPLKGSLAALAFGTLLYVWASTSLGLLISCFVRSQLAAIFAAAIISMIPAMNFSGFLYPLATIDGGGRIIGFVFPASWYQNISLGTFAKGLGMRDLLPEYGAITLFALCATAIACLLLKKQEK